MAEGKKSVVIYTDLIHTVKELTDEEAGRLFKHFLYYVNDLHPEAPDRLTALTFEPIKQQLKRDLQKWEKRAERSRENGKRGGRPSVEENPEKPSITQQVILEPRKPDSVNGNVSVNVNDTVNTINEDIGDKSPPTKTIEEREEDFRISLIPFIEEFSKETVRAFFDYWAEKNSRGKKMRFEMQKTFETKKRLTTWKIKEAEFKKTTFNDKPKQTTYDKLQSVSEEARRIREKRRSESDGSGEEGCFVDYISSD